MRITVAAIGKLRSGPERTLCDDYFDRARRAGKSLGFSGPDLIEREAPKGLSGPKRQAREGALLLEALPEGAHIAALDERGDNIGTERFAADLARRRDAGTPAVAFLIGGADGHGEEIRARAGQILSFGAATWPHMLARAMLGEQLYRAMTILSGHPYHRS